MEDLFETLDTEQKLRISKQVIEELKEENKMLLDALKSAYRCSGERNHLTKPVLDDMLDAINKAEM